MIHDGVNGRNASTVVLKDLRRGRVVEMLKASPSRRASSP
jgi:hypothetical protein